MAGPFAEAYEQYIAAGWPIVPVVIGTKRPAASDCTGRLGEDLSRDEAATWAYSATEYSIALRMPVGVIGLDIDAYDGKNGGKTLADLEAKHGKLPDTWRSSARDDAVSGIRFYRVPAGYLAVGDFGVDSGIEVIQRHHRIAVVWPSLHPKLGTRYEWRDERGIPRVEELPTL